jgi:hypothetical protein
MKRFFDERLIAVAVASAFALGTFNPDFRPLPEKDAVPPWFASRLVGAERSAEPKPARRDPRPAQTLAVAASRQR